jgi:hypothetical protein
LKIQGTTEFEGWLRRTKTKALEGHTYSRRQLELVVQALDELRELAAPPTEDLPSLKRVRQSKRFEVWRTSHAYEEGIAVWVICWFPPNSDTVVVALFANDKARMDDVCYNTVGVSADPLIEAWNRQHDLADDDKD